MKNFMLIAKNKETAYGFKDAQDRSDFMKRFNEWERNLSSKQQFIRAEELVAQYKRVEQKDDNYKVIDGPFTETKEILTGYFLIAAKDMSEAVEIAKTCPVLRFDNLEVFEIDGGKV